VDVVQLGRPIRVLCGGGRIQGDLDGPRHLHVLLQRRGVVHQDVSPLLDGSLVLRPRGWTGGLETSSEARHRVLRVIPVPIGGSTAVGLASGLGQLPSTVDGVRVPLAAEIHLFVAGPRNGPVARGAPLVGAHDEHPDVRVGVDAVVDAFEPVVEPTQLQVVDRVRRLCPEVDGADLPVPVEVVPGPDDKFRPASRLR
jgi:hypothetical protein